MNRLRKPGHSSWIKPGALLIAFGALNFGAVLLGYQFYIGPDYELPLWLSSGVFMGVLMISRARAWPALVLVVVLSQMSVTLLLFDQSLFRAMLYGINNVPEAVVGAYLVRRICAGAPDLGKLSNVLGLVAAGALASTVLTAAGGAGLRALWTGDDYWAVFQVWWFADILGVLVVVPVILALKNASIWSFNYLSWRTLELVALFGGLFIVIHYVFGTSATDTQPVMLQPYIVFPLVLWAALRFGARTQSIAMLITALMVVYYTDIGLGPFNGSEKTIHQIVLSLQAFLSTLMFSSLVGVAITSERKQSLQQVHRNHSQLVAAEVMARLGSWEYDVATDTAEWSDNMFPIFDVDPAQPGALVFEVFVETLVHPDDRERVLLRLETALAAGAPYDLEYRVLRRNGEERTILARAEIELDATDNPRRMVGIVQDITESKLAERELKSHRHHLEELVEERTSELAEARQRAESANQAKSAFLANMSHEIRTPMNAIVGLTHLMQQADPTSNQAQQLTKIDSSARHLLAIINDILDLSKIEAGKLTLEQVDFHIDTLFGHIQSMFKDQISTKNLIIEVDKNDVPSWLRGDLTRLRQALLNYAGNAIKFTENGTISLRAEKLEENEDEVLVRFEVQDTGIGIDAAKLSSLFRSFEQADTSTTRKYGGTGLGLSITRRLAQLMGGEAGAESEPGRGSTFWFTARLNRGQGVMPDAAATRAVDTDTELRPDQRGSRILLAEDNVINREVAVALLSRAGLVVDTAENGREAVAMARAKAYDLVLMDIQMPEMDGLEATRMIRSMASTCASDKDLPILAMTANVFDEDRQACLVVGMNDFVAKPIDVKDMFSTLATWLPWQEPVS